MSALAAGLQGWLFGPCNSVMRGLLLVAAFLAIDPGLKTDLQRSPCAPWRCVELEGERKG
ncbi:MAG: hypothetical protein ACLR0N_02405 [Bilophila wadsworthia]